MLWEAKVDCAPAGLVLRTSCRAAGGHIVANRHAEGICKVEASHTCLYLKDLLRPRKMGAEEVSVRNRSAHSAQMRRARGADQLQHQARHTLDPIDDSAHSIVAPTAI